tara:strand:- start:874 stop:1128 length:255 start_codon:yes stop_codon:yes gene_type:complete
LTKIFRKREWEREDSINPSHYKDTEIEFIEYAKATMTREGFEGALEFNVKKYMHRFKEKNLVVDLKKAEWYLQRLIKEIHRRSE